MITIQFNQIVTHIITPINLCDDNAKFHKQCEAMWDTGASKTIISPKVVAALNLAPAGKGTVRLANGIIYPCTLYIIRLINPVKNNSTRFQVASFNIPNFDVIVGMDIIGQAISFSLKNVNQASLFTFDI